MEHNINNLLDYRMEAIDGPIGKVKDFYFDDETWTLRYIIVETGNWFTDHEVLVSPEALLKTTWQNGVFPVNLTKEQIKKSPDIDTQKPVSRRQEIELYEHYGWGKYWGTGFYAGGSLAVGSPFPVLDQKIETEINRDDIYLTGDNHLRSAEAIKDYHLHALDGDIGHLTDFIIDDKTWKIKNLVVDTRNWLEGQEVLVSVTMVNKIEWNDSKVFLNLSKDSIKNGRRFRKDDYQHMQMLKP